VHNIQIRIHKLIEVSLHPLLTNNCLTGFNHANGILQLETSWITNVWWTPLWTPYVQRLDCLASIHALNVCFFTHQKLTSILMYQVGSPSFTNKMRGPHDQDRLSFLCSFSISWCCQSHNCWNSSSCSVCQSFLAQQDKHWTMVQAQLTTGLY
jgi:hypothetical protein